MSTVPVPAVAINENIQVGMPKNMVLDPWWFDGDQTKFKDWWMLWDTLDMNNFYFLFLLFSDFIRILFSFSFSFLLDDEEAHDKEVT